jgi:hypothetical protein
MRHRMVGRLKARLKRTLALTALLLAAQGEGAEAPQPKEQATNAANPLPTGDNAVKGTPGDLPRASEDKTPPREFVPSVDDPEGQIKAVDFPKDI